MNIFTIGAYGFNEGHFIDSLRAVQPAVFVDIRQRRGVRGKQYAFVNSKRLQSLLSDIGMPYKHIISLSPTRDIRDIQRQSDHHNKELKTNRQSLDPKFVDTYKEQILETFDSSELRKLTVDLGLSVVLFCVERDPAACHRSIVSQHLAEEWAFEVKDIVP